MTIAPADGKRRSGIDVSVSVSSRRLYCSPDPGLTCINKRL